MKERTRTVCGIVDGALRLFPHALSPRNGLPTTGGTVTLTAPSYRICNPVVISTSNVRLIGRGAGATILYSDPGLTDDLVRVKDPTTPTPAQLTQISIEAMTLDIGVQTGSGCQTGSNSALHIVNTIVVTLKELQIITRHGCDTLSGQNGLELEGSGTAGISWTGYVTALNLTVTGDFTRGVYLHGGNGSAANANMFVGGAINGSTCNPMPCPNPPVSGGIGLDVEFGDTNKIFNMDFEGWDTAMNINHSYNGPLAARFEGNARDYVVQSGVDRTGFVGASLASPYSLDYGTNTTNPGKVASGFVIGNYAALGQGCSIQVGSGSPNYSVSGNPCDIFLSTAGGSLTTFLGERIDGLQQHRLGRKIAT